MKRVKAACICQTLHFQAKDAFRREDAAAMARQEVEQYKLGLQRNRTAYKIVDEAEQPDGSILIKVIKQYNASPVGDYLD